ncbi:hypothetical protein HU200_005726 [Digitaria exilis]|uniref:Poly A polymerase head domain-containing protein n=1 Tax=Digitaria exilis TaxID=1010633 RepID=A0A835FRA7_9POAL|nr:hypothetical protein HU200_005726 [Digitaria exilis]
MEVRESVNLTEKEERIFRLLLDVVRHFDLGTQLRVAGGWVRDKLLGEESADIDIAVDNMTARDFCEKVKEFKELIGEKEKINHVPSNPDKSKHLETAMIFVFDTKVDFVNLRSEKYTSSSRIPTVEVGTAEEDAYRRDLTINSLFFNINDNSIEDFTGRGIIDTPLPAKATFLDDPLRVLRAIRFATRFDFTLSEDLKDAASDEDVKSKLGCKISRERPSNSSLFFFMFIIVQVDLMMCGKRPVQAMSYIHDLGLFYVVFAFPNKSNPPVFYRCDWWDEQRQVNTIHTASRKFAELVLLFESDEAFGNLKEELEDEYLSIPTDLVKRVYAGHLLLYSLYYFWPKHVTPNISGLILDEVKDLWRVILLISILSYPEAKSFGETLSQQEDELGRTTSRYIKIKRSITNLDLDGVWKCKPLLTGKDIKDVMQVKACPLIGEWVWPLVTDLPSKNVCSSGSLRIRKLPRTIAWSG